MSFPVLEAEGLTSTEFEVDVNAGDELNLSLQDKDGQEVGFTKVIIRNSNSRVVDVIRNGSDFPYTFDVGEVYEVEMVAQPDFGGVTTMFIDPQDGAQVVGDASDFDLSGLIDARIITVDKAAFTSGTLEKANLPGVGNLDSLVFKINADTFDTPLQNVNSSLAPGCVVEFDETATGSLSDLTINYKELQIQRSSVSGTLTSVPTSCRVLRIKRTNIELDFRELTADSELRELVCSNVQKPSASYIPDINTLLDKAPNINRFIMNDIQIDGKPGDLPDANNEDVFGNAIVGINGTARSEGVFGELLRRSPISPSGKFGSGGSRNDVADIPGMDRFEVRSNELHGALHEVSQNRPNDLFSTASRSISIISENVEGNFNGPNDNLAVLNNVFRLTIRASSSGDIIGFLNRSAVPDNFDCQARNAQSNLSDLQNNSIPYGRLGLEDVDFTSLVTPGTNDYQIFDGRPGNLINLRRRYKTPPDAGSRTSYNLDSPSGNNEWGAALDQFYEVLVESLNAGILNTSLRIITECYDSNGDPIKATTLLSNATTQNGGYIDQLQTAGLTIEAEDDTLNSI